MDKEELFRWMVAYHCSTNLDQHLQAVSSSKRSPLAQGYDENETYRGMLIVANGDTLIGSLQKDRVVLETKLGEVAPVPDQSTFFNYLGSQRNGDGAYVFDSVNRRIIKVRELKNDVGDPNLKPDLYVPPDFVSHDVHVSLDEIGTKTRLAVRLPQAYPDTHALQIKRTAYGNFGMGKVTHFDRRGLAEEFYIEQDPTFSGEFLRPEHKLTGVYRQYERQGDQLERVLEERVAHPAQIEQYQAGRKAA